MNDCDKCLRLFPPEQMLGVKTDNKEYIFCKSCIEEARTVLLMKKYKTSGEKDLLKKINKFLKNEEKN